MLVTILFKRNTLQRAAFMFSGRLVLTEAFVIRISFTTSLTISGSRLCSDLLCTNMGVSGVLRSLFVKLSGTFGSLCLSQVVLQVHCTISSFLFQSASLFLVAQFFQTSGVVDVVHDLVEFTLGLLVALLVRDDVRHGLLQRTETSSQSRAGGRTPLSKELCSTHPALALVFCFGVCTLFHHLLAVLSRSGVLRQTFFDTLEVIFLRHVCFLLSFPQCFLSVSERTFELRHLGLLDHSRCSHGNSSNTFSRCITRSFNWTSRFSSHDTFGAVSDHGYDGGSSFDTSCLSFTLLNYRCRHRNSYSI